MSEKTLQFNDIILNKKEFYRFKEPVDLFSVNVDQAVVSDKFKHIKKVLKHFIGYGEGEIVKPLCIILPQMSSYIKYFENGGKNMSFLIKDDAVWDKYDKIWEVIKDKLSINFYSEPVYEYEYLKAKVREFDGIIGINFLSNGIPKENLHYSCIVWVTIDSVSTIDKKNYPHVYLEECKYKVKKVQMSRFINTKLKSDSVSDLDSDLKKIEEKFDNELKSDSDSE